MIYNFSEKLSKWIGLEPTIVYNILISIITITIIKLIISIITKTLNTSTADNRRSFRIAKTIKLIGNIIIVIILLDVWKSFISDFLTFISFFSAGVAIALRDLIFNFFCGIYIKSSKPFNIEDRIEIGGHLGDVIDIRTFNFSLLEINNQDTNGQSTGVILHCPNSLIFTSTLRNITTGFKYIWNELELKISLDSDIKQSKSVLYRILNKNEILKTIPKKMENALTDASTDYRIYYNNLEPIIYTKLEDNAIKLQVRYLVHPKKARNVEDAIWNAIIDAHKKGELTLFTTNS